MQVMAWSSIVAVKKLFLFDYFDGLYEEVCMKRSPRHWSIIWPTGTGWRWPHSGQFQLQKKSAPALTHTLSLSAPRALQRRHLLNLSSGVRHILCMGNVTLIFALKRALDGLKSNVQNNFSIRQIMCSFHFQMMLHWAGTFTIWFPISTDMSEVLGHIPEKSKLLVMQPLGSASINGSRHHSIHLGHLAVRPIQQVHPLCCISVMMQIIFSKILK